MASRPNWSKERLTKSPLSYNNLSAFIPLEQLLKSYRTPYTEEAAFIIRFSELLQHPGAYHRDHLPGHITGSAWVVNPASSKVLLHHHRNLDKWLQPGGHTDGDANVLSVAMRELEEETGLTAKIEYVCLYHKMDYDKQGGKMLEDKFYYFQEGIYDEIRRKGMFNIIDLESGFKIDFIIVKKDLYEQVKFQNRRKTLYVDINLWIINE